MLTLDSDIRRSAENSISRLALRALQGPGSAIPVRTGRLKQSLRVSVRIDSDGSITVNVWSRDPAFQLPFPKGKYLAPNAVRTLVGSQFADGVADALSDAIRTQVERNIRAAWQRGATTPPLTIRNMTIRFSFNRPA